MTLIGLGGTRSIPSRAMAAVVLLVLPSFTSASACYRYDSERVKVVGTVAIRTYYGPPGYGETPGMDRRERQGILLLAKPICVVGDPAKSYPSVSDQTEITLVPPLNENLTKYRNRTVEVGGTLFGAHTGHHRTPVLIDIDTISIHHDR